MWLVKLTCDEFCRMTHPGIHETMHGTAKVYVVFAILDSAVLAMLAYFHDCVPR